MAWVTHVHTVTTTIIGGDTGCGANVACMADAHPGVAAWVQAVGVLAALAIAILASIIPGELQARNTRRGARRLSGETFYMLRAIDSDAERLANSAKIIQDNLLAPLFETNEILLKSVSLNYLREEPEMGEVAIALAALSLAKIWCAVFFSSKSDPSSRDRAKRMLSGISELATNEFEKMPARLKKRISDNPSVIAP